MSRGFDLSYISPDFERTANGYLSTRAKDLAMMFAVLPRANCVRERAIEAAIAWGVRNLVQWDAAREPRKLTKLPMSLWQEEGSTPWWR